MNENNQNFLQQNIGSITLIVFAAVVFWSYNVFFKSLPEDNFSRPVSLIGQDVAQTLERLKEVSLDSSFFATPEFQNLKEFELIIPSQIIGRNNPFAAIK
ncbi:MAG: hypothetical protein AAB944_00545 [Patescibacteria group bacterium]